MHSDATLHLQQLVRGTFFVRVDAQLDGARTATQSCSSTTLDAASMPPRPSLVGRLVVRLFTIQERRARACAATHLGKHSDEDLVRYGWSPAEIAWLRRPRAQ